MGRVGKCIRHEYFHLQWYLSNFADLVVAYLDNEVCSDIPQYWVACIQITSHLLGRI